MGTRTKIKRESIEEGLEVQMNLASDLAKRNPWMKNVVEKYPNRFYDLDPENDPCYAEFDERFAEIYGEVVNGLLKLSHFRS